MDGANMCIAAEQVDEVGGGEVIIDCQGIRERCKEGATKRVCRDPGQE
jgi:hypothetical protein